MNNKHWTIEEDNILKTYYPAAGKDEILKLLKRSWRSAQCRAGCLNVKRFRQGKLVIKWTDEEIETLKSVFEVKSKKEIMQIFPNRAWKALARKANTQGLSRKAKNNYKIFGDITIFYFKLPANEYLECLIDTEDLNKVLSLGKKVLILSSGSGIFYAGFNYNKKKKQQKYLHRFILNVPKGRVVDHINHNTLDNRKINLKICTQSENMQNRGSLSTNNISGERGVCWDNQNKKWIAFLTIKNKRIQLRKFDDIEEAKKIIRKVRAIYMPNSCDSRDIYICNDLVIPEDIHLKIVNIMSGIAQKSEGEKHPYSKLTEKQVRKIKSIYKSISNKELAIKYNVNKSTIAVIKSGKSWKHIIVD